MKTLHTVLLATLLSTAAMSHAALTTTAEAANVSADTTSPTFDLFDAEPIDGPGMGGHAMGGHGMGRHRGPGGSGHDGMRMLRHIPDLTTEQKTRLQVIAKAAREDIMPMREKMRTAREENRKLMSAPTIDRGAIERARAAQFSLRDMASKRMTQAMIDAAEVLTPAQRQKIAEHQAKRAEKMKK